MKYLSSLVLWVLFISFCHGQECSVLSIAEEEGMPGDTVSVSMNLAEFPLLNAFQGTLNYDPNVLSFVDITESDVFEDSFEIISNEPAAGQVIIVGIDLGTMSVNYEDFQTSAELISIRFVVTGSPGTSSEIFFDGSLSEINFAFLSSAGLPERGELCMLNSGSITIPGSTNVSNVDAAIFNESISPNPASKYTLVQSDRTIEYYSIYNTIGQSILSNVPFQNRIELGKLHPGLYVVQLHGPDGSTAHNLILGE